MTPQHGTQPYRPNLHYITTICSWKSLPMFNVHIAIRHKSDYCNLNNPAQRLRDGAEFYLYKTHCFLTAENGSLKDLHLMTHSVCMLARYDEEVIKGKARRIWCASLSGQGLPQLTIKNRTKIYIKRYTAKFKIFIVIIYSIRM